MTGCCFHPTANFHSEQVTKRKGNMSKKYRRGAAGRQGYSHLG
jgi:hypothetical protein